MYVDTLVYRLAIHALKFSFPLLIIIIIIFHKTATAQVGLTTEIGFF